MHRLCHESLLLINLNDHFRVKFKNRGLATTHKDSQLYLGVVIGLCGMLALNYH